MIQKSVLVFVVLMCLIISFSFVAGLGFSEFWSKITGRAVTPSCTETDKGIDYNVAGTVTCGANTYLDVCTNAGVLKEYYYDAGIDDYNVVSTSCPNGCAEGACVTSTSKDTTGTINISVFEQKADGSLVVLSTAGVELQNAAGTLYTGVFKYPAYWFRDIPAGTYTLP